MTTPSALPAQDSGTSCQLVSVRDALVRLSIGRTKLYALCAQGDLSAIKIGRRTFFRLDHLTQFVASLPPLHQSEA